VPSQLKDKLFDAFQQASAYDPTARCLGINRTLQNTCIQFAESVCRGTPDDAAVDHATLTRLDQLYSVYRDNYGVLMAFHRDELSVPQELQVAAEMALGHRCLSLVRSLCEEISRN